MVPHFPLARALGIWLALVATESVHGVVRRLVLEPELGDVRSRQVSVFSGAVLIVLRPAARRVAGVRYASHRRGPRIVAARRGLAVRAGS